MHRFSICFGFLLVGASPLAAQPQPADGQLQRFDAALLRLKRERSQWQLWAGNLLLKDFGPSEADAVESLQIFRDLRLNSRGSIGGVFEYYLSNGQAPTAATRNKLVIPFDPDSLRVEQQKDRWLLRDRNTALYDFAASQDDAVQALNVCRQYGFNQLGVIGQPTPTLRYLFRSSGSMLADRNSGPIVQASVKPASLEPPHPQLKLPGLGSLGEVTPMDARRLELRREQNEWAICLGRTSVFSFATREQETRATLHALQQFRCTELCRIAPEFAFFLSNGHAPQGTLLGLPGRVLKLETLNVRKNGGAWSICEDRRPMFTFGESEAQARNALASIRHFKFDSFITLPGGAYLFVRSR